jgi:homoserine dehydrogenase
MIGEKKVRVGLLGCGVVGGAVARILIDDAEEIARQAGVPIELRRVAVRNPDLKREADLTPEMITTDAESVVRDPDIDIVVETIGGVEPAKSLIKAALGERKHVVTANKELLAQAAPEVMSLAQEAGTSVLFEASVAGGIPVIRPIRESLAGDRVHRIMGIVNGTTNFILTRMSDTGETFEAALAEADRLGYTEADPSADVDGHDAASKLAILASLAFNVQVVAEDVTREGIKEVTPGDIAAAHALGYEVKLLAVADDMDGQVDARVHPAMLPRTHPLAAVRDEFNAVFLEATEAGELMFFGRGAGGGPTASSVVGDLIEAARSIVSGAPGGPVYATKKAHIRPAGQSLVRYYVVLSVPDQPGVLSAVAGAFADNGVSISSVRQEGFGDEATLVLITHLAPEKNQTATIDELGELDAVDAIRSKMRVLGTPEG